jgi:hypothetical protein
VVIILSDSVIPDIQVRRHRATYETKALATPIFIALQIAANHSGRQLRPPQRPAN